MIIEDFAKELALLEEDVEIGRQDLMNYEDELRKRLDSFRRDSDLVAAIDALNKVTRGKISGRSRDALAYISSGSGDADDWREAAALVTEFYQPLTAALK